MIHHLRGRVVERSPDRVALETVSGVAYELSVPATLPDRLTVGEDVLLYTVLVVRDDALELYGFGSPRDRELFRRLRTASGVGPRLALAVLGALPAGRVVSAIRAKDHQTLQTVSGVGKKTAERIALELTDRLDDLAGPDEETSVRGPTAAAVQALRSLGYGATEAERAVQAALSSDGAADDDTENLLRRALQHV